MYFTLLLFILSFTPGGDPLNVVQLIRRGELWLEQDEPDSAMMVFNRALKMAEKGGKRQEAAEVHLALGKVFAYQGDYDRALDQVEQAGTLAKRVGRRGLELRVMFRTGELYLMRDEPEKADSVFNRLILNADRRGDRALLAETYNLQSKVYSWRGELDRANELLEEARKMALGLEDKRLAIDILTQLATNYKNQQGQPDRARRYFEMLVRLKEQAGITAGRAGDLQELAALYRQQGDPAGAQRQLLRALDNAGGDTLRQIEVLTDLGSAFIDQQQWDQALNYLRQARALAAGGRYLFNLAGVDYHLGVAWEGSGNREQALASYRKALSGFEQLGNDLESGRVLSRLTLLYRDEHDYGTALLYLQKALDIKIRNQELPGEAETRAEIGRVLLALERPGEALAMLLKAVGPARKAGNQRLLYELYQLLSEAYARQQDFRRAYEYYRNYHRLGDSLFNEEKTRIFNEINAAYDTERLRNELQEKELQRSRAELSRRQTVNLLLGGALLSLLVIGLLSFRNYRSRQRQELQRQRLAALEKEQESQQLRSMIAGEEQERRRIAQELHDGLGTLLATVKLHFNAVENELPDIGGARTFRRADELLDEACGEVRKISYNLLPAVLQQYGLEYALQDLCDSIGQQSGLELSFIPFGLDQPLGEQVEASVYRIVQELLKNVLKHAGAGEVIVQVTAEDGQLNLVVEDDGKGFDPRACKEGIGLDSIRSRVALLHGSWEIDSAPGRGTSVTIDIPLSNTSEHGNT